MKWQKEILNTLNLKGDVLFNEPMSLHTSFQIGGEAELYIRPQNIDELTELYKVALRLNIPLFILGGGSNIVVSDRGVEGIVIDMGALNRSSIESEIVTAEAGCTVSDLALKTVEAGYGGLDFLYKMPGSLGGAVWMNARCYGSEISTVFKSATFLNSNGDVETLSYNEEEWSYKVSPFQQNSSLILSVQLKLHTSERSELKERIASIACDREEKGHFSYPCAGSVFKNSRDFGVPTGKIIDNAGLRGATEGGAQVSPLHGNIIINRGQATAEDVWNLTERVKREVFRKFNLSLEPEILFVGK